MIDQKTPELHLPLPHAQNPLNIDVERIRESLSELDRTVVEVRQDMQNRSIDGGYFSGA